MLKLLLTVKLVVTAKVATQVVFTNMATEKDSQIPHASNTSLWILTNSHQSIANAKILTSAETALLHHAKLENHA
jgi:hypothetical protein